MKKLPAPEKPLPAPYVSVDLTGDQTPRLWRFLAESGAVIDIRSYTAEAARAEALKLIELAEGQRGKIAGGVEIKVEP